MDNVHKLLNEIISTEADLLSPNGVIFSGFSIPQNISSNHDCLKAHSQHFSFEEEARSILNASDFSLSEINFLALARIYLNQQITEFDSLKL